MHYNLLFHDLRARTRAAESSKNQLENELARVQNQLNLASQREADISAIANNHERQIQFLSQSQEHVRRRVYEVATYTARGSKGKVAMANNDEIELVSDDPLGQSVEQESEEVRRLKHQPIDMYHAWVSGQPPPQGPSERTSTLPQATQPLLPATSDHILPPGYVPNYSFHTGPGISNAQPPATSVRNTPLVPATSDHILPPGYVPNYSFHTGPGISNAQPPATSVRNTPLVVFGPPVYIISPLNIVTRPNIKPLSYAYDVQYYSPDMAFKGSAPHNQTPQYVLPAENERAVKTGEPDEMYNIDIVPDRNSLSNMKKKPTGSFREYAVRWREQASRVKPPTDDHELIIVFLQAQDPDYFQNMMAAMGRPFADVIKIGETIENGLSTGRIISQAALKAATKEIQNMLNSCVNQKKNDEEAMMASRAKRGQKGASQPSDPRYSVAPQYATRSYAKPSKCQHMRALTLTYLHSRHQNSQSLYNACPKQEYEREQKRRDNFTPIVESYTSLFERLKHCGMIEPLQGYIPNPVAKGFKPVVQCLYHSNVQGHSTEDCRALKKEIEMMIQEGMIVIQDNGTLNVMIKHAMLG
ncbi:PREDICTED: uncharacterized protein LOC109227789 [Nicotiana attenuata]|uniref:uncharacterized protein LOC109227789 n=1 Tax=Nicotiana attenuata TaxID=49451 RepID=UPI00090577EC|nr:PREDICTED: uncharacterized protein LOC109227789 [Nicotiana attenuata]